MCSKFKERNGQSVLQDRDGLPDASRHLWKPFSLEFDRAAQEKLYHNISCLAWVAQDCVGHSIGCFIIGPVFVYTLHSVLPLWYSVLWLCVSWGFAAFNVYACLRHRGSYEKHRLSSIVGVRVGITFLLTAMSLFTDAPDASIFAIFSTILTRSPTGSLFYASLVHRVEFRYHMLIQCFALVQALAWIPPFCKTCTANPEIAQKFNQVGYGLDWLFGYALLNVWPDPADYPCWIISAFFVIVVGFVLPTFAVFVAEVSARTIFLQSRVSTKFHPAVCDYAEAACRVALLGMLAATVGTWFILSLIRSYLYG